MKKIVYLHGFLSSPKSVKAQQTVAYCQQYYPDSIEIVAPQLANTPEQVAIQLAKILREQDIIGFIGSSLGGYLASYCAAKTALPAVLINPAAYPYQLLSDYLGEHQHPYTNEKFVIDEQFNAALRQFDVTTQELQALKISVWLQTEDETLNYKEAEEKYKHNELNIQAGGSHAFDNYLECLPTMLQYLFNHQFVK
ncbi:hypothetical protein DS2_00970 [Catenovulum agarivorans DS-2]|uniref:Esterase YqiA n=1 Tax=Catenovulum agarivorans DS-2 TaxID=1328313 RepID=W7QH33_9ALTE|nr:YqiA/YcfP family alpha/beta fold hydrolase [Catenovulum agarivorans]EWH12249.1 hypothetical protein DS2_00970 [Catenovulum agarivorans DS-2]